MLRKFSLLTFSFAAGSTFIVDDGWKLIVRSVRIEDSKAMYSCSVLDSLTGDRRRSTPVNIDVARKYYWLFENLFYVSCSSMI